jgi:hypothetical protein
MCTPFLLATLFQDKTHHCSKLSCQKGKTKSKEKRREKEKEREREGGREGE